MPNKKILAVSSPGGHWVQLCRLVPSFDSCSVVYAGVYTRPTELNSDAVYYQIGDVSRDTMLKIPKVSSTIIKIIRNEKPNFIITTGALPGLLTLFIGKLFGIKTIWLDSIANSESISASGRLASYIADDCFTQWPNLTTSKIKYIGRVV